MRSTYAVLVLSLSGCWNGADAVHLPCTKDEHCGRGQSCIDEFCDGPPVDTAQSSVTASDSSSTASSSTESGDDGDPPGPACEMSMQPATRTLFGRELVYEEFRRANAVVAAELAGDPGMDLAVLSRDGYAVLAMENAGAQWELAASTNAVNEANDMLAVDLDGNTSLEFLVLSFEGQIQVLSWDGTAFADEEPLMLDAQDLRSFTTADLVGDALPELVVSGSSAVHLVPNEGGVLASAAVRTTPGEFLEPWDTLVVGQDESMRVLVPESDNASFEGVENQYVHALRLDGGALVGGTLATNFRNPWAVAEGDFIGDDELEIVVAERSLDGSTADINGTSTPGRLRFFSMEDGGFAEIGEPLEVGVGPISLAAADLDCDGKTDLALGNTGTAGEDDGRAQVLFGSREPIARAVDLLTLEEVGGSGLTAGWRLAVADFDGDGLLEVAIPDTGDLLLDTEDPGGRVVFVGVQGAP